MPKPIMLVPPILAILVAVTALTVLPGHAEPAADSCIIKPNSDPPQGSHWYYRVDRAANRRCWFLGPEGAKVREAESPKRIPSARSSSQPAPESSVEGGAGQNGLVADATSMPVVPKSADIPEHEPALMTDSNADKRATTDSEDEILVPTVTTLAATERAPQAAVAERPPEAAERPPEAAAFERAPETAAAEREPISAVAEQPLLSAVGQMLAMAGGVLALVAIIFLAIYKLLVAQKLQGRRNHLDQWRVAAKTARSRELLCALTSVPGAGHHANKIVRAPVRRPRNFGVAVERINRGDASRDLEEDLRRLVHVTRHRAA
jgi:hypothetical protein